MSRPYDYEAWDLADETRFSKFLGRLLFGSFEPHNEKLEFSRELSRICLKAIEKRANLYLDEKLASPMFFKQGFLEETEEVGILFEPESDEDNYDGLTIVELSKPDFDKKGQPIQTIKKIKFLEGIAYMEEYTAREFNVGRPDIEPIMAFHEMGTKPIWEMTQKIRDLTRYSL
jgi:hypothetical protein